MPKVALDFLAISNRIREMAFPEVDVVVGIGTGGIVPASLIAFHLHKEIEIVQFNFRDEHNKQRYDTPQLLKEITNDLSGKRILLVDDVAVSGKTMEAAKELFAQNTVLTCVMKGKADVCIFPDISDCVRWPWKLEL